MHITALVLSAVLGATPVVADGVHAPTEPASANDVVLPPPPTYKAGKVAVDEKLGALVPIDAKFQTSDGQPVVLGALLDGELPTILTFNYSDCPMLCSLQLNGLTTALPEIAKPVVLPSSGDKQVAFKLGTQFRIITIDLEPKDPVAKLAKMKERYIQRLPAADRDAARKGWTFLAPTFEGDGAQIARVAQSVGFKYEYVAERAEWAHPAALIYLSSRGTVTRYVYGIDFPADIMRESIVKAGLAEQSTAVGFMNRCYHYDPSASDHSYVAVYALRIGAAAFLILFVIGIGVVVRRRREVEA
ncbi:MAG TPA: SCO family protein [Kofleriaceae bacterium]